MNKTSAPAAFLVGLIALGIASLAGYYSAGWLGFWAAFSFFVALIITGIGLACGHWAGMMLFIPVWILEMWLFYAHKGGDYMESVVHCQGRGIKWCFSVNMLPWLLGLGAFCYVGSFICKSLCDKYE